MRLKFIPRENTFWGMFSRSSANVVEGAKLLKSMVENYDDPREWAARIMESEHEGDSITHEIIRTLNTTFITPIDREDIHALATGLDDVLDFIEAAADLFVLYNIEKPSDAVIAQVGVLFEACEAVHAAVTNLEKFKGLEPYWIKVHEVENKGDRMYRRAVADLFNGRHKSIEVLKWKEIHEQIEASIDACEGIANVLEAIVLKNA